MSAATWRSLSLRQQQRRRILIRSLLSRGSRQLLEASASCVLVGIHHHAEQVPAQDIDELQLTIIVTEAPESSSDSGEAPPSKRTDKTS
jgi:hypothetical protein